MSITKELISLITVTLTICAGALSLPQEADAATIREQVFDIDPGTRLTAEDIETIGSTKDLFQIYKIKKNGKIYKRIRGKSMPKTGFDHGSLRYIKVLYRDFKGKTRSGEIIVNKSISKKTRRIFLKLYKKKYRIRKMRLVDDYFPKSFSDRQSAAAKADDNSMNDDNTSAFNYRYVLGTKTLSKHSYGRSIDVNPFENPYCFKRGGKWVCASNQTKSAKYLNRTPSKSRKHMIQPDSYITKTFQKEGFTWLGYGSTMRDYQHFEC